MIIRVLNVFLYLLLIVYLSRHLAFMISLLNPTAKNILKFLNDGNS